MFAISLNIPFSKSKIKDENLIGGFIESNAKVVRFDISVNEMSVMNILNSGNHLINQHEN